MANPERGLYDSDEDIAAYIARILSKEAPDPQQLFNYEQSFAPGAMGRINAQLQPAGPVQPATVTPTAGISLGPLSAYGGANISRGPGGIQAQPIGGASLQGSVLGGEGSLGVTLTPQQRALIAEWKKTLEGGGELSLQGRHTQSTQGGRPETYFGLRGRIPF